VSGIITVACSATIAIPSNGEHQTGGRPQLRFSRLLKPSVQFWFVAVPSASVVCLQSVPACGRLPVHSRFFLSAGPFKLGNRIDDTHGQFSGRTGEVYAPQRQTMYPDPQLFQSGNCRTDIHGVATQSIGFHLKAGGLDFQEPTPGWGRLSSPLMNRESGEFRSGTRWGKPWRFAWRPLRGSSPRIKSLTTRRMADPPGEEWGKLFLSKHLDTAKTRATKNPLEGKRLIWKPINCYDSRFADRDNRLHGGPLGPPAQTPQAGSP